MERGRGIYLFDRDAYGGDDRIEYIRRELAPLSEG